MKAIATLLMKAIPPLLITLLVPLSAWGASGGQPSGQPFQNLQEQITQLDSSTSAAVQALAARVEALEADQTQASQKIADLETQLAAETAARLTADKRLQNVISTERANREAADTEIQSQLGTSKVPDNLMALAGLLKVVQGPINGLPGPHIIFEGANVHIESGSGATDDNGNLTGLGNLIIGYDAPREDVTASVMDSILGVNANNCAMHVNDPWDFDSNSGPNTTLLGCGINDAVAQTRRTGSHNLIIGDYHNFNSYGGIVAGIFNATDKHAVGASVLGGAFNLVTHPLAIVVGGENNKAMAFASAILGGDLNTTEVVVSTDQTTPTPPWPVATVFGSYEPYSTIVGGRSNLNASQEGGIFGGSNNVLKYTERSAILGGLNDYVTKYLGSNVVLLGGIRNTATDANQVQPIDATTGAIYAALSGGSCSSDTKDYLDILSVVPDVGPIFSLLDTGYCQ